MTGTTTGRIPLEGVVDDAKRAIGRRARGIVKLVSRTPVANLALAAVRTGGVISRALLRDQRVSVGTPVPDVPEPRLNVAVAWQVALDECVLAMMNNPSRLPDPDDLARVGDEVAAARELFRQRGWLDSPVEYHRDPPPLDRPGVRPARWLGLRYEQLMFESGYEPHPGEPGRERWLGYEPNRTAYGWVLRHQGPPRPWLVCLHGFGTGRAYMDFYAFRAAFLHHALGLNLAIPVHAMHGPRSVGRFSGAEFMSYDLMNMVHGMAQSAWDVRRILSWIRATQDPSAVGVYGVSLGGYLTGLMAGLEGELDCAIAGIPVSDLPTLMNHHAPDRLRRRADSEHLLGDKVADLLRVVSPLALEPRVPHDRRFVFAGRIDRMATPHQAQRLWEHWDRPRMAWYDGNHVGFLWSHRVDRFVQEALAATGLASPPAPSPDAAAA